MFGSGSICLGLYLIQINDTKWLRPCHLGDLYSMGQRGARKKEETDTTPKIKNPISSAVMEILKKDYYFI